MKGVLGVVITCLSILCFFNFKLIPTPYQFPKLVMFPPMPISDQNQVTEEGVDLGRHLFYDPILSADSTMSCASCHRQESAFADGSVQFSKGINGHLQPRNTMPLFNLAWYAAFFWDGKASSIEAQVFHPVRTQTEMNLDWTIAEKRIQNSDFYQKKFNAAFDKQPIDSTLIAFAIAQFERTLISHNSKYDSALRREVIFTYDEHKGLELVTDQTKGDCLHCHPIDGSALGTTGRFSNNGLDNFTSLEAYPDKGRAAITGNPKNVGQFKIPSLRNLLLTAPYMHDGRFETLEEVLDFYSEGVQPSFNIDSKMGLAHQGGVQLTKIEKAQIIAFLHTLTDSTFIQNPKFSNPFSF